MGPTTTDGEGANVHVSQLCFTTLITDYYIRYIK